MCFVFIWEHTATCATYSINWLVFITEMKSVNNAVRTGSLNSAVCVFVFTGLNTGPDNNKKPNGHVMHQQYSTTVRSAHTVFMCFVFIWVQTATCVTYSINWLVFITEMKSVYSAVRTGSLNKAVCVFVFTGLICDKDGMITPLRRKYHNRLHWADSFRRSLSNNVRTFLKPGVHYRAHSSPSLVTILSRTYLVHSFPITFL
jgi:hypothetical protein